MIIMKISAVPAVRAYIGSNEDNNRLAVLYWQLLLYYNDYSKLENDKIISCPHFIDELLWFLFQMPPKGL